MLGFSTLVHTRNKAHHMMSAEFVWLWSFRKVTFTRKVSLRLPSNIVLHSHRLHALRQERGMRGAHFFTWGNRADADVRANPKNHARRGYTDNHARGRSSSFWKNAWQLIFWTVKTWNYKFCFLLEDIQKLNCQNLRIYISTWSWTICEVWAKSNHLLNN